MSAPEKIEEGLKSAEIEITPEMIEAGVAAWRAGAGDEYPRCSMSNDLVVSEIYEAMRRAATPKLR